MNDFDFGCLLLWCATKSVYFDYPLPKKQVVLAPIAIGMATNKFFPNFVKKILPFAPVVGVVSTCLLVASAVAQVADPILAAGWSLQVRTFSKQSTPFVQ